MDQIQNQPTAADVMLRLFDGYEKRHIELHGQTTTDKKGKVNGKPITVDAPLSVDLAARHIDGGMPVGVAPVKADSTCSWGVLDVDWYDMPEDDVMALRDRLRTRCAAFRTKSRGLHIVVFVDEPIPAKQMYQYLAALRKRLPKAVQAKTEIFPKETQTVVTPDNEPTAVWLPINGQLRECACGPVSAGMRTITPSQSALQRKSREVPDYGAGREQEQRASCHHRHAPRQERDHQGHCA